jgi:hypothetical protein
MVLAFVPHGGAGPHYEFAGLWLMRNGRKLYARNANGHTLAEDHAAKAKERLHGELPQDFLDYWVEHFPIRDGLLTEPETITYASPEVALSSELAKHSLH